jgi:NIMA (never in mitosis gene a)-related kinase
LISGELYKIGDFGISAIGKNDDELGPNIVGTLSYISPEQIEKSGYNSKTDVWSLGCILYEICTLDKAF